MCTLLSQRTNFFFMLSVMVRERFCLSHVKKPKNDLGLVSIWEQLHPKSLKWEGGVDLWNCLLPCLTRDGTYAASLYWASNFQLKVSKMNVFPNFPLQGTSKKQLESENASQCTLRWALTNYLAYSFIMRVPAAGAVPVRLGLVSGSQFHCL